MNIEQLMVVVFEALRLQATYLFQDDKKLIRYREGKIVSTKGERFSQVTKEESQEMKKSIVNIHLLI